MNEMTKFPEPGGLNHIELTAGIVSAYVANNHVRSAELPDLIAATYAALTGLTKTSTAGGPAVEKLTPAQIRKSISPDALISFEDGKPYKTLRRHLTIKGLSPDAYKAKWGLPSDYPMTAASYSEQRSELAKSLGLGQQRIKASMAKTTSSEPTMTGPSAETAPDKPKKAGRPRKTKEPVKT